MNLSDLKKPFDAKSISWRVGATNREKTKGLALAYINARDVVERLDEVIGPENWQCRHETGQNGKVTCHVGIKCGKEWVWKSNGAGATDYEGDKGSYSDSFKRAAVMWGVGEYLYHLNSPWVEIDDRGRIKQSEMGKLAKIVGGEFYSPKGVTQLLEDARALSKDIEACEDEAMLAALLESKETKELIDQIKVDRPGWWHGMDKDGNAPGLKFRIDKKFEELKGQAA